MISNLDIEDYIELGMPLLHFMCTPHIWDSITETRANDWLSNFSFQLGRYFALKILLNALFYSEEDMITLLEYRLFKKIKELIRSHKISVIPSVSSSSIKLKCGKTLFVPLLDRSKPHESGLK